MRKILEKKKKKKDSWEKKKADLCVSMRTKNDINLQFSFKIYKELINFFKNKRSSIENQPHNTAISQI